MLAAREVNIKKKLGARSERVLAAGEKFSETDTPKPSILSFVCQLKILLKYTMEKYKKNCFETWLFLCVRRQIIDEV